MILKVYFYYFSETMSSFMNVQGDTLDLMDEEDFSYADGLNLDQELSYFANTECSFTDFNFQGSFLS